MPEDTNKKYAILTLFGEKEGIFRDVLYVMDYKNPNQPLLFDTKCEAKHYSKYISSWHVVEYE